MLFGDVSELADEHDLGSCAERREGSIPSVPTLVPEREAFTPREAAAVKCRCCPHPVPLLTRERGYLMEKKIENR